jgi:hypothetical protein
VSEVASAPSHELRLRCATLLDTALVAAGNLTLPAAEVAAATDQLVWLLVVHEQLLPALHQLRTVLVGAGLLAAATDLVQGAPFELDRALQTLRNSLGHLYELPMGAALTAGEAEQLNWSLRLTSQLKVALCPHPQSALDSRYAAFGLLAALVGVAMTLQRLGASVPIDEIQQALLAQVGDAAGWPSAARVADLVTTLAGCALALGQTHTGSSLT